MPRNNTKKKTSVHLALPQKFLGRVIDFCAVMLEPVAGDETVDMHHKLLYVPQHVANKKAFSNNWFRKLIEFKPSLSPYLIELFIADLQQRELITAGQYNEWKVYEGKRTKQPRRPLKKQRNRTRFYISLPPELPRWVTPMFKKIADKDRGTVASNQANYIWNLFVRAELKNLVKAQYEGDAEAQKAKYTQWSEEWTEHCLKFHRVGAPELSIRRAKAEARATKRANRHTLTIPGRVSSKDDQPPKLAA